MRGELDFDASCTRLALLEGLNAGACRLWQIGFP